MISSLVSTTYLSSRGVKRILRRRDDFPLSLFFLLEHLVAQFFISPLPLSWVEEEGQALLCCSEMNLFTPFSSLFFFRNRWRDGPSFHFFPDNSCLNKFSSFPRIEDARSRHFLLSCGVNAGFFLSSLPFPQYRVRHFFFFQQSVKQKDRVFFFFPPSSPRELRVSPFFFFCFSSTPVRD